MNLKYRRLKAFCLAAATGSFSEAAKALSVTPASFSNLIKELEADIGVVLFNRTTRRCELSDAGQRFLPRLAATLAQLEELYGEMIETGQGKRGKLSIATLASISFGLLPAALADFRQEYPDVDLVLHERNNDEVFGAVRRREVELGLASLHRPDSELHYTSLFTDRLVLVTPAGHPLAGRSIGWRALEEFPYISMATGPAEHAIRVNNLNIKRALAVEHVATAVAMVRHGFGITALPSTVLDAMNLEGVTCSPIVGRLAVRALGVAHRRDSVLSRVAENFIGLLRNLNRAVHTGRGRGAPSGTLD